MKAIFKSALVAIAAISVGVTGCQKDVNEKNGKETKSVSIKLMQPEGTRAEGPSQGATTVILNSAEVFFTDARRVVIDKVQILFGANANQTYNPTAKTVGINEAQKDDGFKVVGLPSSVTQVVIIGNLNGVAYPAIGDDIDDLEIGVQSQYDATNKGVANVTMFGYDDDLDQETIAGDDETNENGAALKAEVKIAPVSARIEITAVAGNGKSANNADSTIEEFVLEGIYINFYHPTMVIDGADADAAIDNGNVDTNYTATAYSAVTGLFDEVTGTAANSFSASTGVWGYNLLAPTASTATGGVLPADIVLEVSGVEVETDDATTYAGTKWLTVRKLLNLDNSNAEITVLAPGTVYKIAAIAFHESRLEDEPYAIPVDVYVEAELMDWKVVNTGIGW